MNQNQPRGLLILMAVGLLAMMVISLTPVAGQTYPPNKPRCALQDGDYSDTLKSFPPGSYAWGEFVPWLYTTWGYLNIESYTQLDPGRPSKYSTGFLLDSPDSSTKLSARNVICPTPAPTPRATRPPPEPTPYPVPAPTPLAVVPTPAPRTRPPAPGPTPLPPTPASPPRTQPPPPTPITTLPPPLPPQVAKTVVWPDLNWTMEFWVLLNDYPSQLYSFVSQNTVDGGPDRDSIFFAGVTDTGKVLFFLGSGQVFYFNLQTEMSLELLTWYHIAILVESTTHYASNLGNADEKYAAIWINGKLAARAAFSSPTRFYSESPIQIGRYRNNVTTYYCNCFIDEVRFWDDCQDLDKLYSRVNMILSPSEPDLVGYWNFEDDTVFNQPDLSFVENTAVHKGSSAPYLTPVAEIGRGCDRNYGQGNWVRQFGQVSCS